MTLMRLRNCKIVATLGPASDAPDRIRLLYEAGADAFRLNFSHGEHGDQMRRLTGVRAVEKAIGRPIPVIADLQGPKIRVGRLAGGAVDLKVGERVELTPAPVSDVAGLIPIPHPELLNVLEKGDSIRLDDGRLALTVVEVKRDTIKAKVDVGGKLSDRKGVNVPGRRLPISALTDKDRTDLAFAIDAGVDVVALSFVQSADDVREARALIGDRAAVLVKIERPTAVENLEAILDLADAVMVARGDLGVELSLEQVPVVQRRIISTCRSLGRPVIVATQMLESMITAPAPTRAEASDVATAVYQGADAVMLSAESAVGRHAETAVAIMDRLIRAVEEDPHHWLHLHEGSERLEPTSNDAISHSAREIAELLKCRAILAFTNTGSTAVRMSRERPHCFLLGLTPNERTARKLSLSWGVHSVVTEDIASFREMVEKADTIAREHATAKPGDLIIVTAGIPFGRPGTTNTLKIVRIGEG